MRLLNRAWAQSVTGDLGAARRSYEQVAGSPAASAGQRLQALGWWVFDLPLDQVERYRRLGVWTADPRFPPAALARLEASMLSAGAISRTPGYAGLVAEEVTEAALSSAA